jgi:16S rRNA (guanine527-N7)-methyltransferase
MSPGPSLIREGAEALEVALSEDAAATLWTLVERMLKWNRRINIVGPCDATQAIDRHIHDGLALLRLLDTPDVRAVTTEWTDIGAGGGFPGLVLAIARPELKVRLVEPTSKKIAFARDTAGALGLQGVEIANERLEALEPGVTRGAMSRATFAPMDWITRGRTFVATDSLILATMGGEPVHEVVEAAWRVDQFTLPISGAGRTNAIIRT